MQDNQDKISLLLSKLEALLKRQENFVKEINQLREEITLLKTPEAAKSVEIEEVEIEELVEEKPKYSSKTSSRKLYRDTNQHILGGVCSGLANYFGINRFLVRFLWVVFSCFIGVGILAYILLWIIIPKGAKTTISQKRPQQPEAVPVQHSTPRKDASKGMKPDLENFIGANLINKIGIAITIIGVAIGAKYSIDNDLISPLTRIILGYLVGLGLLGFGIKLKRNYENFSAVLVSGAMAIMYVLTYIAYSFYDLFPQIFTFVLMLLFTVFTVLAALKYNKQLIAHIGLVGAYAAPFLLSEGSGEAVVLFSYMAIINFGILVIAFKKYWKPLYFSSFLLTWLIYFSWFSSSYQTDEHFGLALTFLFIFFTTFYLTLLAYKLLQKEKFNIYDVMLVLANSFVFYGIGYAVLSDHQTGEQLLGVFTLCNALIHFIVGAIIYRQKLADKNLFYLITGMVLVFITIAIPVQLDGNWVTLLWVGEAALLFWIGRTKSVQVYENISYALMTLAVFSIFQDWAIVYHGSYFNESTTRITPLFNIHFLTSLLFIAAFSFITVLNGNKKYHSYFDSRNGLLQLISFSIPAILLTTIFFAFRMELANYWDQLFEDSLITINSENDQYPTEYYNYDLIKFKTIWLINYTLLFLSILSFINIKKIKNRNLGVINLGFNALAVIVFLIHGLLTLSQLRESYLEQTLAEYYQSNIFNIGIRYVSFAFVLLLLISCYKYIQQKFIKIDLKMAYNLLLHITILWIMSSELIHWMDMAGSTQSYKLGLSILWGIYALLLIVLGIWKIKKYLRVSAIVLFSITLIKLFVYDISHLNTIAKTIVFVSLGILLLIISFLYNKYKHKISDESES